LTITLPFYSIVDPGNPSMKELHED